MENRSSTITEEPGDEFDEMVAVLQLDGVLDFDAVRKAVGLGAIRVRECDTETPMVQIGSHLYSGQWTQTLGTDMLFCPTIADCHHQEGQQRLELIAVSDTRLSAQKVLLATDENPNTTNGAENEQRTDNSTAHGS